MLLARRLTPPVLGWHQWGMITTPRAEHENTHTGHGICPALFQLRIRREKPPDCACP